MNTPSRPSPRTKNDVAHPATRRARDIVSVALLVLGAVGLNAAAYTTDPRLGTACTSLSALAAAAVLGRDDEQP
ncbi:hypothetical protein OH807_30455 [Kitasatospora sp. NBC_01560]|uniref:hypothetical protein n=1 Tax=Kitasatospora sp. NBC_01560 TaxID=2975965 RepID=UPI00386E77D3